MASCKCLLPLDVSLDEKVTILSCRYTLHGLRKVLYTLHPYRYSISLFCNVALITLHCYSIPLLSIRCTVTLHLWSHYSIPLRNTIILYR